MLRHVWQVAERGLAASGGKVGDAAREITCVDSVDFGDGASGWLGLKVSDGLGGGDPGALSQIEAVAVDACGIEMHAHGTLLKIVDDSEVLLGLGE